MWVLQLWFRLVSYRFLKAFSMEKVSEKYKLCQKGNFPNTERTINMAFRSVEHNLFCSWL